MMKWKLIALAVLLPSVPVHAQESSSACEAYGKADAVFVGEAGAPARRVVSGTETMVTPITIEHAYRGVSAPVAFVMAAGSDATLVTGQHYLVYAQRGVEPGTFVFNAAGGAKELPAADDDVRFLEAMAAASKGGTINGT